MKSKKGPKEALVMGGSILVGLATMLLGFISSNLEKQQMELMIDEKLDERLKDSSETEEDEG